MSGLMYVRYLGLLDLRCGCFGIQVRVRTHDAGWCAGRSNEPICIMRFECPVALWVLSRIKMATPMSWARTSLLNQTEIQLRGNRSQMQCRLSSRTLLWPPSWHLLRFGSQDLVGEARMVVRRVVIQRKLHLFVSGQITYPSQAKKTVEQG